MSALTIIGFILCAGLLAMVARSRAKRDPTDSTQPMPSTSAALPDPSSKGRVRTGRRVPQPGSYLTRAEIPELVSDDLISAEMNYLAPIVRRLVYDIGGMASPGDTTAAMASMIDERLAALALQPAFPLVGFPASCAISVNDEVLHVPPAKRVLAEGDVFSIQLAVTNGRAFAQAGGSFFVGTPRPERKALLDAGVEALDAATQAAYGGQPVRAVSAAIQEVIERRGFAAVRDYVGSRIGRTLHESPQIPCYDSGDRTLLEEGWVLTINVIAKAGSWYVQVLDEDRGVVSRDGSDSVLFAQMVRVGRARGEAL